MIAKARLRYLKTSPQKVRLVVDQIRNRGVEDALSLLRHQKRAGHHQKYARWHRCSVPCGCLHRSGDGVRVVRDRVTAIHQDA